MNAIQRSIEYENDRVTVIRYRFAPHAAIPMHTAPDLVAVYLTEARLKLTFADGTFQVEDHQAGEIAWLPAQQHSGENLQESPLEFIAVQLKSGPVQPGA